MIRSRNGNSELKKKIIASTLKAEKSHCWVAITLPEGQLGTVKMPVPFY